VRKLTQAGSSFRNPPHVELNLRDAKRIQVRGERCGHMEGTDLSCRAGLATVAIGSSFRLVDCLRSSVSLGQVKSVFIKRSIHWPQTSWCGVSIAAGREQKCRSSPPSLNEWKGSRPRACHTRIAYQPARANYRNAARGIRGLRLPNLLIPRLATDDRRKSRKPRKGRATRTETHDAYKEVHHIDCALNAPFA